MTRTLGVEEEMFLVDGISGRIAPVSEQAIRRHESDEAIEHELFLEQIETMTEPRSTLADLRGDLVAGRRAAIAAARSAGAQVIAAGTAPLPHHDPRVTPKPRYERMSSLFGGIGPGGLACGMHVHVGIDGPEEGVAILDRIRPWLSIVRALAANSPFADGDDTGHASWRTQLWDRWPSAGPVEPFGDLAGYRRAVADLIETGAAVDEGMVYFDARLARSLPTVEVRVADVCTDVSDATVVAGLIRGLVETAARDHAAGGPVPPWRVDLLRGARWHAARYGVSADLVDPVARSRRPALEVVDTLLDHVGEALADAGDTALVTAGVQRIVHEGNGADRQRAVDRSTERDGLRAVVADLVTRTAAESTEPVHERTG
ncbi:carboxylate-amine ligase [Mumia flava]|uniref:Putative glutamate--cysteine ligase 2 n=1 Tax=Mumia flava TaxID=1348852 RepID=A0A0B2B6R5_9ACTN|nr:glutamate--cysteine ligase [Mumia flava]PJJ57687.1 carboxylate-amine ligase [Mumia flava]